MPRRRSRRSRQRARRSESGICRGSIRAPAAGRWSPVADGVHAFDQRRASGGQIAPGSCLRFVRQEVQSVEQLLTFHGLDEGRAAVQRVEGGSEGAPDLRDVATLLAAGDLGEEGVPGGLVLGNGLAVPGAGYVLAAVPVAEGLAVLSATHSGLRAPLTSSCTPCLTWGRQVLRIAAA